PCWPAVSRCLSFRLRRGPSWADRSRPLLPLSSPFTLPSGWTTPWAPVVLWLELALVDLLHEADDAVVVPATAVDNAELPALAVVVGEEVVADQLHLEQRLIDGHRVGCVELLPDDERAFAFHLDRHQAGHGRLGFGLVLVAGEGVGVVLRQRGQR